MIKRMAGASFPAILLAGIALAQGPSLPKPPETPKRPVTDEYHGVKVSDDYRWLEDWNDPQAKRWSAAENAYARAYLDQLAAKAAIKERFQQLIGENSSVFGGNSGEIRWCGGMNLFPGDTAGSAVDRAF